MGFTKILYLDVCLHPLTDLSSIFDVIDDYGLFTCSVGNCPYESIIPLIEEISDPTDVGYRIPHLHGYLVGFNFCKERICELFERWEYEMRRQCYVGDDIVFVFLAWQLGLYPHSYYPDIVELSDFPPLQFPPRLLFYQDTHKQKTRSGWGSLYEPIRKVE